MEDKDAVNSQQWEEKAEDNQMNGWENAERAQLTLIVSQDDKRKKIQSDSERGFKALRGLNVTVTRSQLKSH